MYQDNVSNSGYLRDSDVTTEAQDLAIKLGAVCRVYEQTDRVLTQDPIHVHVVNNGNAPAWSDGADIYINREELEEFDLQELVQITGLNYHELSHHLYTPRKGTSLMQWLMAQEDMMPGYMAACNMLEDQRIETLFIARYPAVVPYLTKTVLRWLGNSPETMAVNYPCIRGRQYLPLELRMAFRDQFIKPELISVIADIVDQYRVLHFPKGYAKAQELIKRFKEEVLDKLDMTDQKKSDGGPSKCASRTPVNKGRPEAGKAQERDSQRAQGMSDPEPEFVHKPEQVEDKPDKGERDDDDLDINTPPSTDRTGSNLSDNFIPPTSAKEAIERRDPEQGTPAAGRGHAESLGGIPDDIMSIINDIEQSIYDRKDVQTDIKTKQRVIVGGDGKHQDGIKRGKYDSVPVHANVLMAARRFARELERLKQECEPTWQREMPAGRVNVQRVIRGCEIDNAFDRWEEGTDGTDIETVLLIDRSGSMGSNNNDLRASEAAWVVKRAMEQVDAPVTVYSFDDKAELVNTRSEKVEKSRLQFIYGSGGTNPQSALIATERLFKTSKSKSKLMFLVTDGQFDHQNTDQIIQRMNAAGVITVFILIANEKELEWLSARYKGDNSPSMWHECTVHGTITSAADLIPFAKQIVTSTIKKAMRH